MPEKSAIDQLRLCVTEQRTGVLQAKNDKIVRQFRFKLGNLVSFFSNTKSELVGSHLFKKNILTKEAYEKHLQEIATIKSDHWEYFVQTGVIAKDQVAALKLENLQFTLTNLAAAQGDVSFQAQEVKTNDVFLPSTNFVLTFAACLSMENIFSLQPAFQEENAGVFLPKAFEKEIPPLPITPEEKGLLVVVKHNNTLKDVLSSSFLGRERIFRLLFAYSTLGWVILKGSAQKAMDDLLASLTPDQAKLRKSMIALHDNMQKQNYYDWLAVAQYATNQEIQQAALGVMETTHSPATEKVFLKPEHDLLAKILKHAELVRTVLTHPSKRAEYDSFLQSGSTQAFGAQNQVLQSIDTIVVADNLEREGKKDAALEVFETAMKAPSVSVEIQCAYLLAVLRIHGPASVGHKEKVMGLMKNLLEKHSQHPQVLLCASEWLRATNQMAKSYEFIKKGFLLYPNHPYFRALLMNDDYPEGPQVLVEHLYSLRNKMTYYQWLNLSPQATASDIRKAYRETSKILHPDKFFQSRAEDLKSKAKEIYKRIVEAYTTLKDNDKKRAYDQAMFSK